MICVIIGERQLWKKLNSTGESAATLINLVRSATKFILIAIPVFLLSGLWLLYSKEWIYLKQTWFIIKFVCFLLFVINGAVIGGKTVEFIAKHVQDKNPSAAELMKAKARMGRFHVIQFVLVTVIIFLATFKSSF